MAAAAKKPMPPKSKPTQKKGAADMKHKQQQQHKGKASSKAPAASAHSHNRGKPYDGSKHSAPSAPASSVALQNVVAKMMEEGVFWYQVVKPLKELKVEAPAASAPAKGNGFSRKKNKKLAQLALEKAAAAGAAGAPRDPLDLDATKLPEEQIEAKKRHAQRLLEEEVQRFETKKSGKMSSDDKYLATMMKSGTLADRVAALTLTIQGSPFHCLSRLSQLITMASKKARRESMMAVDSLKDLFINNLLPDERRLNFFHQNPLHHPSVTDEHLVVWFYEHCLKTAFAQLVGVLANGMDDAVDNHKRACIRAANALLAAKPEQEAVLLAMLVNKLGDPDRKIASYIHKTLQELLQEHPAMKRVVIDEVERVLTRPQVSDRTKYNAILFINQIYLDKSGDDSELAAHLITVYFGLFTKEVHGDDLKFEAKKNKHNKDKKKKKSEPIAAEGMDRKLLSALLVGVNRAFPYAKTTSAQFHDEIDSLFTVVHRAHHSTSVQALMLLFQVMNSTNSVSDRFYTALYDKLFDPKVRETSKHTLFLNLIFRAMKADVSPARSGAMMKRLLQLTTVMTPAFTCAVLFLLSELMKIKPTLRTLIDQPESGGSSGSGLGGDGEDEHFEDAKADSDDNDEEERKFKLEDDKEDDEETDEERELETPVAFNDGLTDAERSQKVLEQMFGKVKSEKKTMKEMPTAVTFDESDSEDEEKVVKQEIKTEEDNETKLPKDSYDPRKRNPLYAGAENACAWELHHLVHHYHPSVQVFARQLIENKTTGITYAGDPLVDFTMHAFFEKFMNKKPRHKIEASSSGEGGGKAKSWSFAPINTEAVLQEAEENLDESDKFFYKFFKERATREATMPNLKKKKKSLRDERVGDALSDIDSDEDEELEAYAQELAEGIMQDGDLDHEDPDIDDWSDGDDDEDDDGGELDDDEETPEFSADFENGAGDDSSDDEEDVGELDGEDGGDMDDDDEDDEDGFDFAEMDGLDGGNDSEDEEEVVPAKSKSSKKTPPAPKRKSPFASADDYDTMVQEALAKQQQVRASKKQKRKLGSILFELPCRRRRVHCAMLLELVGLDDEPVDGDCESHDDEEHHEHVDRVLQLRVHDRQHHEEECGQHAVQNDHELAAPGPHGRLHKSPHSCLYILARLVLVAIDRFLMHMRKRNPYLFVSNEQIMERERRTAKHNKRDRRDDREDAQRAHADVEHQVAELHDPLVQQYARERDRLIHIYQHAGRDIPCARSTYSTTAGGSSIYVMDDHRDVISVSSSVYLSLVYWFKMELSVGLWIFVTIIPDRALHWKLARLVEYLSCLPRGDLRSSEGVNSDRSAEGEMLMLLF